jgi:hypothetical protein
MYFRNKVFCLKILKSKSRQTYQASTCIPLTIEVESYKKSRCLIEVVLILFFLLPCLLEQFLCDIKRFGSGCQLKDTPLM